MYYEICEYSKGSIVQNQEYENVEFKEYMDAYLIINRLYIKNQGNKDYWVSVTDDSGENVKLLIFRDEIYINKEDINMIQETLMELYY